MDVLAGVSVDIRALALADGKPVADKPAVIEIRAGSDRVKVFREEKRTSAFGVVWADFELADEEADVRLAAATALGWSGFNDDSGYLLLALEDSSQRVQAAVIKSLGLRPRSTWRADSRTTRHAAPPTSDQLRRCCG